MRSASRRGPCAGRRRSAPHRPTASSRKTAATSPTSYATWCMPGPRFVMNRPTGVSSPVGSSSSMRSPPTRTDAAETPWSASVSRLSTVAAEQALVRRHGLVEIDDGNAEMMDPSHLHAARSYPDRAYSAASVSSLTVPTVSLERDSGTSSDSISSSSSRSSVSCSSSAAESRSSSERCLRSSRCDSS